MSQGLTVSQLRAQFAQKAEQESQSIRPRTSSSIVKPKLNDTLQAPQNNVVKSKHASFIQTTQEVEKTTTENDYKKIERERDDLKRLTAAQKERIAQLEHINNTQSEEIVKLKRELQKLKQSSTVKDPVSSYGLNTKSTESEVKPSLKIVSSPVLNKTSLNMSAVNNQVLEVPNTAPIRTPRRTAAINSCDKKETTNTTIITHNTLTDVSPELDKIMDELEDQDPTFTTLDLGSKINVPLKSLVFEQIQDFAELWGQNETVETASLKGCGVNTVILQYLLRELNHNLTLSSLDLSDNVDIDDNAVKSLVTFIESTKVIESLNLSGCGLSDKSKKAIQTAHAKNKRIKSLVL
jgi:vacuolar-type H+-ATPase subunit I/STV1